MQNEFQRWEKRDGGNLLQSQGFHRKVGVCALKQVAGELSYNPTQ